MLPSNNGSIDPTEPGALQNRLALRCDHHTRHWVPSLPPGGCMTPDEIKALLVEQAESRREIGTQNGTQTTPSSSTTITFTTTATTRPSPTDHPTTTTTTTTTTTAEAAVLAAPMIPMVSENSNGTDKGAVDNVALSHGSSAAVGAIFGFLLCLLILLLVIFVFRQRLSRLVRSKLVTSSTLPGRFPGSGMFMNTLSGPLTFSRRGSSQFHRKSPFFSSVRRQTVLMSQSAVSIPHHHHHLQHQWFESGTIISKPASTAVSMGNLHPVPAQSKPPLPRLPPPSELEVAISDNYAPNQHPPSSVTTNSTSLATRRQTLLSADTATTNISGGPGPLDPFSGGASPSQPSPMTVAYQGASAEGLVDGFVDAPDDNQVFSATLPWKSKPRGGVSGGLKRLSTFLRSAVSGSSSSFLSHGKRQPFTASTTGWSSRQHVSSGLPSSGNSVGLLSPTQSRSSYTSDATIQAATPLGSLGRNSAGHVTLDHRHQVCLVDPSVCRLNHQHRDVGAAGGMLRTVRQTPPLPPIPPPQPPQSIPVAVQGNSSTLGGKKKTGTLNMDTYLEPIDGVESFGRSSNQPEDLSVTEVVSGGSLSDDSDTGQQASWPSITGGGEAEEKPEESGVAKGNARAPLAVSDPAVSLDGASFEDDSSAANYFTYDENHRARGSRHGRVIRRPQLSPPSPRSRPLSDAMMSNHYYDKSELLTAIAAHTDAVLHLAPPGSRPNSIGIYSNDDSSVYEAVDDRRRVGGSPSNSILPSASPPLPVTADPTRSDPSESQRNLDSRTKYRRRRGSTKIASTTASTSTLLADLSPVSRSSLSSSKTEQIGCLRSRSPSPALRHQSPPDRIISSPPHTQTPQAPPYANLSEL
uniref:SH2 domain-containing protein n=1 Tax=Mesocestoides corti TaxID=53468 RepID=A0A5K3EQN2_MESCO